jgi:hypothetical protein
MATVVDALRVTVHLDASDFLEKLAELESSVASGARALVQSLAAPLAEAAASPGLAGLREEAGSLASALREAAGAAAELASALDLAVKAMGEMSGASRSFANLGEDIKEAGSLGRVNGKDYGERVGGMFGGLVPNCTNFKLTYV